MEYRRLRDVSILTQYGYTAEKTSCSEGVYKYLRITDIVPYFVDYEKVPFCEIEDSQVEKYQVEEGDILVARTGATTGYNYVVPKGISKTVYASYLIRFRIDPKVFAAKYIKYVFKSQPYYGFVYNYIGGAAQPGMNAKVFGRFNIPFWPLPTQWKIAKVLSAYDDLIENNTKRIRILERMAEELYKEWFVRFRFPGHEKAKFVNGLPEGWNVWRVDELALINTRSLKKNSALREIKYLDTGNATRNDIGTIESFLIDEAPGRAKRLVKKNSIIYSTVRPNLEHHALLLAPPDDLVVSTGFAVLDCKWDVAVLIYMFLRQPVVVDYLSNIAEGAVSTYPSITPAEIGRLRVALPEKKVAEELNGKLYQYFTETDLLQRQNALLARQRDLLLPRLMSGKLSVEGVG